MAKGDLKGCVTPASKSRIPDGADSPAKIHKFSVIGNHSQIWDRESENACEAWDGQNACVPLKEIDYLRAANGQA